MSQAPPSLLDYVDAPIVVGDPDGRTVYVNPAFEKNFSVESNEIRGVPLATLFEGGAREAILRAVADVFGGAGTARFQLREEGRGFVAIASPISAAAGRVGVIILLTAEPASADRLIAGGRGLAAPLDELTRCLAELTRDPADVAARRNAVEEASNALDDLRKRVDDLLALLR